MLLEYTYSYAYKMLLKQKFFAHALVWADALNPGYLYLCT